MTSFDVILTPFPRYRLLKGIRGGGSPPPGFGAIGGGVGAFRDGAGREGINGGAVERAKLYDNYPKKKLVSKATTKLI